MLHKMNMPEHVSDELLAAYLDGNTTPKENELIQNSMAIDAEIFDVVSIASESTCLDILLPVFEAEFNDNQFVNELTGFHEENIFHLGDRFDDLLHSNQENQKTSNLIDIDMKTYGEERNYRLDNFDHNIFQGQTNACAVKSQEIILRDYGIVVPQEELEKFAEANGWYIPAEGTPVCCVGNILEAYGVQVNQTEGNTVFDLVNELSRGHRVIVGVDANELWAKNWMEKKWEQFKDRFDPHGANHALIVAGVEVNPNDMNDIKVILTDPGKGDLRIAYTLEEFHDAWADSNFMMVSTTQPAPYQYNADTQQLEYSQFATNFIPQSAYDFQHVLLPDFNDYCPFFDSGHLNFIGYTPIDQWMSDYNYPPIPGIENIPIYPDIFGPQTPPPPMPVMPTLLPTPDPIFTEEPIWEPTQIVTSDTYPVDDFDHGNSDDNFNGNEINHLF